MQKQDRRTVFLGVLFESFATENTFFQPFALSSLGLNRDNPARTFGGRSSLKYMLVSIELERKVIGAFFGHIGDLGLQNRVNDTSSTGVW